MFSWFSHRFASRRITSHHVTSRVTCRWSCLVSSRLASLRRVLCRAPSRNVSSFTSRARHVTCRFASVSRLVSPRLVSSRLVSSRLVPPRLVSSRLVSSDIWAIASPQRLLGQPKEGLVRILPREACDARDCGVAARVRCAELQYLGSCAMRGAAGLALRAALASRWTHAYVAKTGDGIVVLVYQWHLYW